MPALLKKYHDRENGFTLIELLIVVLIVGILAAIAIPVYLGIQQQGYKAAVRSDVNISVKRVQVAITEGASVSTVKANPGNYTQKSVRGENLYIANSTTSGASADDFALSGVLNTSTTPAGPINYSYSYDSVTGQFTDSSSGLAFGSANPTITITTGSLPTAVTGTAYSQTLNAATTSPASTTVWSATGLPTGWSINSSTGTIAATAANVNTTGSYSVAVTATNGSVSDTRNYTLTVKSVPTISTTSIANATVNAAYNQTISASGSPAPTFTATGLPTGLSIGSTSGVISGTPTTSGNYTVQVTADNGTTPATQSYSMTVGSAPSISTTSLPWAYTNAPYSVTYAAYNQTVAATGYPSPTYTVTAGSLPTGLNLNAGTGAITGTPTVNGTSNFTVTAQNALGTNSQAYTFETGTYIVGCDDGAELAASQGCGSYGTYYNPNSTYTTAQAYNQSWSWKITTTNQGAVQGIISCPGGQNYNLPAGTQVQAGLWIEGDAGDVWSVGGRTSYDEANGQNGVTTTGFGSSNWIHATANYTLTQASTSACIQVRQNYNYVGWNLYADNLSIAYAKP